MRIAGDVISSVRVGPGFLRDALFARMGSPEWIAHGLCVALAAGIRGVLVWLPGLRDGLVELWRHRRYRIVGSDEGVDVVRFCLLGRLDRVVRAVLQLGRTGRRWRVGDWLFGLLGD